MVQNQFPMPLKTSDSLPGICSLGDIICFEVEVTIMNWSKSSYRMVSFVPRSSLEGMFVS